MRGGRKRPSHSKASHRPFLAAAVGLLLIGAALLLIPIAERNREIAQDEASYEKLRKRTEDIGSIHVLQESERVLPFPFEPAPTPSEQPVNESGRTGVDLAACKAQNKDFVAWLQIPHTPVDYPVVSTDDTKHYLTHTFTGKKSYLGALFSLGKTDYFSPSQNIAIYGHHIRSNKAVMFSPLLSYKDADYYAEHALIFLDSLYHTGAYRIFAVLNMRSGDWEPSRARFTDAAAFLAFVGRAKAQALYDTGVEVAANDEILTLITCDRSYDPVLGRLVVMAVKETNPI